MDVNRHGAPALEDLPPRGGVGAGEVRDRQRRALRCWILAPAALFRRATCRARPDRSGGQFAAWAGRWWGWIANRSWWLRTVATPRKARLRLARVGIERVQGVLEGGIASWYNADLDLSITPHIRVRDLHSRRGEFTVVDVRTQPEFDAGHIPGALLHPLDRLRGSLSSLDRAAPIAVHCRSGYRSTIACSLLEAAGFTQIRNLTGGYDAWTTAGLTA